MNLRTVKRRHDARTVQQAKHWAYFNDGGSFDHEADDMDWLDDEPCPNCLDDGRDPWSDYMLPCPACSAAGA